MRKDRNIFSDLKDSGILPFAERILSLHTQNVNPHRKNVTNCYNEAVARVYNKLVIKFL